MTALGLGLWVLGGCWLFCRDTALHPITEVVFSMDAVLSQPSPAWEKLPAQVKGSEG